jgi:chloramphenicol 3-O-phosphotransferase
MHCEYASEGAAVPHNWAMLLVLSGSSGAGKTTLARAVSGLIAGLHVHELGEIADEPWSRDRSGPWWRRDLTERWLQRAILLDESGEDLLLTEGVLGEVLAAPSAEHVSGIAACLIDCEDSERLRRIRARGETDAVELQHFVNWSVWLRGHAADPQYWADPIRQDGDMSWHWDRWERWTSGDPRWSIFRIDTTHKPVGRSADRLVAWLEGQRALKAAGKLPLSGRWWD